MFHSIVSLLKSSPKGEGFSPFPGGTIQHPVHAAEKMANTDPTSRPATSSSTSLYWALHLYDTCSHDLTTSIGE